MEEIIDLDISSFVEGSDNEFINKAVNSQIQMDSLLYEVDYLLESAENDLEVFSPGCSDIILKQLEGDLVSSDRNMLDEEKEVDRMNECGQQNEKAVQNDVNISKVGKENLPVVKSGVKNFMKSKKFCENSLLNNDSICTYVPKFTSTPLRMKSLKSPVNSASELTVSFQNSLCRSVCCTNVNMKKVTGTQPNQENNNVNISQRSRKHDSVHKKMVSKIMPQIKEVDENVEMDGIVVHFTNDLCKNEKSFMNKSVNASVFDTDISSIKNDSVEIVCDTVVLNKSCDENQIESVAKVKEICDEIAAKDKTLDDYIDDLFNCLNTKLDVSNVNDDIINNEKNITVIEISNDDNDDTIKVLINDNDLDNTITADNQNKIIQANLVNTSKQNVKNSDLNSVTAMDGTKKSLTENFSCNETNDLNVPDIFTNKIPVLESVFKNIDEKVEKSLSNLPKTLEAVQKSNASLENESVIKSENNDPNSPDIFTDQNRVPESIPKNRVENVEQSLNKLPIILEVVQRSNATLKNDSVKKSENLATVTDVNSSVPRVSADSSKLIRILNEKRSHEENSGIINENKCTNMIENVVRLDNMQGVAKSKMQVVKSCKNMQDKIQKTVKSDAITPKCSGTNKKTENNFISVPNDVKPKNSQPQSIDTLRVLHVPKTANNLKNKHQGKGLLKTPPKALKQNNNENKNASVKKNVKPNKTISKITKTISNVHKIITNKVNTANDQSKHTISNGAPDLKKNEASKILVDKNGNKTNSKNKNVKCPQAGPSKMGPKSVESVSTLKRPADEPSVGVSKKIKLCESIQEDNFDQDVTIENFTRLIFDSQKTMDENDPNWCDIKDLGTAEEFFNHVFHQWQSEMLPNPHIDLTKRFTSRPVEKKMAMLQTTKNSTHLSSYYNQCIRAINSDISSISAKLKRSQKYPRNMEFKFKEKISELQQKRDKMEKCRDDLLLINKFYHDENKGWDALFLNKRQLEDLKHENEVLQYQHGFYCQ